MESQRVDVFLLLFQEFNPNIQLAVLLEKSERHSIPLTGNVECVLSGCYDDSVYSQRRLIPNITFSCRPAISSMYILIVTTSLFMHPSSVQTLLHTCLKPLCGESVHS